MKLYKHQREGINFLYRNWKYNSGSILAMDPGTGKTITALVFCKLLFHLGKAESALFVVPRTLIPTWQEEIKKVFSEEPRILKSGKIGKNESRLWITTYDMLKNEKVQGEIKKLNNFILVGDEAHEYCTKTKSKRWAAMYQLKPLIKILLTGTPIYNRIEDLYGLISLVNPQLAGTKLSWLHNFIETRDIWIPRRKKDPHCKCFKDYGRTIGSNFNFWTCPGCRVPYVKKTVVSGYKEENIPALRLMLKEVMLRKLKTECLDLPPKNIIYLPYELNTSKAQYRQWEAEGINLTNLHNLIKVLSGSLSGEK